MKTHITKNGLIHFDFDEMWKKWIMPAIKHKIGKNRDLPKTAKGVIHSEELPIKS